MNRYVLALIVVGTIGGSAAEAGARLTLGEALRRRITPATGSGVAPGCWVHPAWFIFTAFVGVNLLPSSFTSFCPLERVLGRFGLAGRQHRAPT